MKLRQNSVNFAKILEFPGALDHDERWGTLWRRNTADDEAIVMLEVVNHTRERDGSFKRLAAGAADDDDRPRSGGLDLRRARRQVWTCYMDLL